MRAQAEEQFRSKALHPAPDGGVVKVTPCSAVTLRRRGRKGWAQVPADGQQDHAGRNRNPANAEGAFRRGVQRRLRFIPSPSPTLDDVANATAVAWKIADQFGWPDTFDAEYLALTQLQADAFVTLDKGLIRAARGIVSTASIDALEPISVSS